jgi:peptide/nickel transport system substrate-binding protein
MENRFGVKDLFLFLLIGVLIVIVALAMKQNDRQYLVLEDIKDRLDDQLQELTTLNRNINRLQTTGISLSANPSTPATDQSLPDPFIYMKQAEAMPGYAQGDWFIEAAPNSDKITPLINGDTFGDAVNQLVMDGLVGQDEITLQSVPNLATSWQIQDNTKAYSQYRADQKAKGVTDADLDKDPNLPWPLKITFQMRPGVVFSDGVPLTADDVVWTFNWIMNPQVDAARARSAIGRIKSVVATNDHEVVFTFREPYFDSLNLAGGMLIMPKHFYEKYSVDEFNKSTGLLMGSNAYRMEDPTSWSPGQDAVLVRNDRYWGEQPAISRIIYRVIDQDLARQIAFRNGEIDVYGDPIVYAAQPEPYDRLLQDPSIAARTQHFVYDSPAGGYRFIAWNQQRGGKPSVFADKRVRQAMTMLMDRDRICKEIMRGYVTPISGPFYPLSKQINPDVKPLPFDVDGAKALLKEAGFKDDGSGILKEPDGSPFQFKLTYPSGVPSYDEVALFLKDAFAKAGITLIPDSLDWSVFGERLKDRNFEAISLAWTTGIEDDIYQIFDSSQIADQGDNFVSYKNPDLDKLIEQARATVDPAVRMPLWKECHRIIADDQPYTFLFSRKSMTILDSRFKNVKVIPIGLNSDSEWFVPLGAQKWEK